MPDFQTKYDLLHARNVDQYSARVRAAYLKAIKAITELSKNLKLNGQNSFYFSDHPEVQRKVNNVLIALQNDVYGTLVEGINSEWDVAVEKNNAVARAIWGKEWAQLPAEYRTHYLSNNAEALFSFLKRVNGDGLGLSDQVWKLTKQFEQEMELALEVGLEQGKSSQTLARQITRYLNSPDKLFRRVRDKSGELRLSKAAAAYHPGQGVYRSSYKNAWRLARNEINFSYEGSQYEKRQQQDFIVGVEIRVSPNHNPVLDKGGVQCLLLQGRYPKDFNFTYKWHVNCMCMSLNIVKTKDELSEDLDRILAGQEPVQESINKVSMLPDNYKSFLKDNEKNVFPVE